MRIVHYVESKRRSHTLQPSPCSCAVCDRFPPLLLSSPLCMHHSIMTGEDASLTVTQNLASHPLAAQLRVQVARPRKADQPAAALRNRGARVGMPTSSAAQASDIQIRLSRSTHQLCQHHGRCISWRTVDCSVELLREELLCNYPSLAGTASSSLFPSGTGTCHLCCLLCDSCGAATMCCLRDTASAGDNSHGWNSPSSNAHGVPNRVKRAANSSGRKHGCDPDPPPAVPDS